MSSSAPSSGPTSSAKPSVQTSKSSSGKSGRDGKSTTTKKKARRKKPSSSGSSKAPNAQAVLTAARAAQSELNSQKALEAARRKDPLWYRASEVTQAISADATPVPKLLNEQVDLVENALKANGLSRADVTPQAFGVLLEQARRHAIELVEDAQDYAYAAHRHDITRADLMLASEFRPDQATSHTLAELQKMTVFSHNINKIPLPTIPSNCYSGVVLPPRPHQLTTRTFDVVSGANISKKMSESLPSAPSGTSSKKKSNNPSYGATKGRQIPVNMKSKEDSSTADAAPKDETKSTPSSPEKTAPSSTTTPADTAEASSGAKRKAGEM